MGTLLRPNYFSVDEERLRQLSNLERKKYLQKIKILKYIYQNEVATLSEIFNAVGISSPTCLILLHELIADNVLEKNGKGESIGGRKPDIYLLKDATFYIVSIDMEKFRTRAVILDNNNNFITTIHTLGKGISKDESTLTDLYTFINELITSSQIDKSRLVGIGISMPGLVDAEGGTNYTYLQPKHKEKTLQQVLEEAFGYPVFLQNDVKCAAIAESKYGLAKGISDALVVLMDWGVGLGIIMDGKMRKGSRGFSGEVGHIPLMDEGALCYCGKKGCLETVASGVALARMAKEGIKSGQHSLLNELSDYEVEKIEPHLVIDAANRGDQYAISILSVVGNNLGKGIATLVQLFNPELIILGGKMAEAKQYITIPIIQAINTYSMTEIRENTRIDTSALGQDSCILGVASMVINSIIERQVKLAEL
ncbi:ROK family protein [Pedobacter rhodius]|uniref:ROK family protein n=1 Tax=Pedobacter rhodius TaxID=3004098 RepID=A0ABT4KVB3_9SPHI|nr:ROK family protein [Pedobacter sp. SJ11]MCZ4222182.1 ROK family protein [Pedobacter sp. SJ11]